MRAEPLSPRSVQYAMTVLRLALKKAERWELVSRNVASLVEVKRPRTDPSKVFAYSVQETRQLLGAASGDRLEALYVLVALLGLRRGEALGLRWSDVDLDRATLRVEQTVIRVVGEGLVVNPLPKTRTSRRTISLRPRAWPGCVSIGSARQRNVSA